MVPFCWLPCSAYDEVEITDCPPKHGSTPSVSPEPRSQYGHPLQARFCGRTSSQQIAQHIGRRLLQPLQQGLIGLEDAEVGVVRQNQILDGIEGVHPLPLRAQHLLQQPQILDRNAQRLRRRFQKLQFFRSMAAGCASSRATASRSPTSCPARAAARHDECRAFASCSRSDFGQLGELRHHRAVFLENAGPGFIRPSACPSGPQNIPATGRRAASAPDGRLPSTGTTLPSPRLQLSVSPAQSASWELILAARNRDRQFVQHRQTARAQPRVVQAPPARCSKRTALRPAGSLHSECGWYSEASADSSVSRPAPNRKGPSPIRPER